MKSIEELREIKRKFKKGEIAEEELDQETQDELLELYKEDITEIRQEIMILREENRMYEERIRQLRDGIKK